MKISDLKANPKNPRIIKDDKFKKLVKSLQEFPEMMEKRPMVCVTDTVDGKLFPLGGNMRLKALQELKYKDIPDSWVMLADEWTEEKRQEFVIKDNLSMGDWSWDELNADWDLQQLEEWGLDIPDFEAEVLEAKEDDFDVPEGGIETDIVLGDLFEIGNHRLLCGDSTDSEQVAKLMNGEKADLAHNDPPYGMKKEAEGVLNDNLNYDDLLNFNKEWIALQFTHIKENGSWYCWGIDEPLMDIYSEILKPYIKEQKATFRNLITWDKGNGQGQNSADYRMYPIADEKCLFVQCGIQCLTLNADQYWEEYEPIRKYLYNQRIKCGWDIPTMKTIAGHSDKLRDHWTSKSQWNLPTKDVYIKFQNWAKENNINAFEKEYDELRKEYDELRAYFDNTHDNMNNVWHFNKTSGEERESAGGHATPKPIALCSRAIKSSSRENEIVLDLFLGSGSTMVAAHQLKRKCYGMELDCKYCQVIVDRMRKLDPTIEIKKNGIPY